MQAVAIQSAAEVVRGGDEKLPQHFGLPRRQGFRVHGVNVGVGHQAQSLKPLLRRDSVSENGNGSWIENVAALHGLRHVQVMLDQKMNFVYFVCREAQPGRGAVQGLETADNVILDGHAFADVVQEKSEDQKVAAV